MKKLAVALGVSMLLGACAGGMGTSGSGMSGSAGMSANPMVGGAPMYASKDIVDNAVNSQDHTTLVAAVKAAGLVDTLLKPENKGTLTTVLTYHVVPGRMDAAALMAAIAAGGGRATLKTASGGTLTATTSGGSVMVTDAKGGTATVTIANVYQSNGVIHVVNKVLLPG